MANLQDIITRRLPESSIVYVFPNVSVAIYESGTSTLVWQGQTNADGVFVATGLTLGKYDIKVNGILWDTREFPTLDYIQKPSETLLVHAAGSISSDSDQSANTPIFAPARIGTIQRINWSLHYINATGDITAHVLRGSKNGAAALTVASDSAYNWQINPGSEYYGHAGNEVAPAISVTADQIVTIGWDYTAGTIQGLTVEMLFKPDEE